MKRTLFAVLAIVLVVAPLAGCGSGGGEDYNPDNIAVKQPGDGPPPMGQPMTEGQTKTTG